MGALIDETGNRYGRWMVIRRAGKAKSGHATWFCRCDCGTVKLVIGKRLRAADSKSCGCYMRDRNSLPDRTAAFNNYFSSRRNRAKKEGKLWELTKEQVRSITSLNCYYCGREPLQRSGERHNRQYAGGPYIYNGLDRIDNSGGYTIDNIVPCCGTCNLAKKTASLSEFRDWIAKAYNHLWQEEYA